MFIEKVPEFKVFIYDMFGLSWLPWGKPVLRGSIIILLFVGIFILFRKNTKKLYVLYFFINSFLLLWPSLLGHYNPRYIYESYPFIFLGFIFLFKYSKINLQKFSKYLLPISSLYIIFLITFLSINFRRREQKYNTMRIATENLIQNPKIKDRALCFLGYPADMFGQQNAAIFWVLLDNPKLQIYFDPSTAITQVNSNLVQDAGWCNIISDFHDKNYFKIIPIKGGFRFKSLDPKKVNFNVNDYGYSLGQKIVIKTEKINNLEVVTEFDLIIDQKYLNQKPLFIQWNYKTRNFEIII